MNCDIFGAKLYNSVNAFRKRSVAVARKTCYKVCIYVFYSCLSCNIKRSVKVFNRMASADSLKHLVIKRLRIYTHSRYSARHCELYLFFGNSVGSSRLKRVFINRGYVVAFVNQRKKPLKLNGVKRCRRSSTDIYAS